MHYLPLNSIQDPLPSPEKDFVRLSITDDDGAVSSVFAVHKRIARHCKLLDSILDELDLLDDESGSCGVEGSASVPDVDPDACVAVFDYLNLITTRIPTLIPRPLRVPLREVLQPWENDFLQRCIENRDTRRHEKLLEIMKVSDFLIVDPLRDLCCAFMASILLDCSGEAEVLNLLGLPRPPTSEEMEPLFDQFPFLQ
jgi:hypothetical protein